MSKIGEVNNSIDGKMAICREDVDGKIYVIFESDNNIVGPREYSAFKSGKIRNFKRKNETTENDWIVGETIQLLKNVTATCISYTNDKDICVAVSTGDIVDHITVEDFLSGNIEFSDTFNTVKYLEERRKETRENIIRNERIRTYNNVVDLLYRYHKCAVVRPCGFGKTYLAKKLFKRYKKCLYLYPQADAEGLLDINDSLKRDKKNKNKMGNVTTMTYVALARKTPEQIAEMEYDLVFMDEMQYLGAGKDDETSLVHTYPSVKKLMELHPYTHFVGATATPQRMDGVDVISDFFNNKQVYPYTIEDAMEDGLFTKPKYLYCTYGIREFIRKTAKSVQLKVTKKEIEDILGTNLLEQIDAENMDKAIVSACKEANVDTDYMRYIAFYRTVKELKDNKDKVVGWFQKAFPNHNIYVTEIHSKSVDDIKTLRKLPIEKNRIDLIFNCEILNLGYHEKNLTGIILDRKTFSLQKYWQMIGRVFSMDSDKQTIVFDIEDNIHSDFASAYKQNTVSDKTKVYMELENKERKDSSFTKLGKKENITFQDVLFQNPNAIRWDKISERQQETRSILLKSGTTIDIFDDDGFFIQDDYFNKQREYESSSIETEELEEEPDYELLDIESIMKIDEEYSNRGPRGKYEKRVASNTFLAERKDMDDDLGYDSSSARFYLTKDGRMISKCVDIMNDEADVEAIIKERLMIPVKTSIEHAIVQLKNFPNLSLFSSYEEYLECPKNSQRKKIFDAVAWTGNVSPEMLLKYIVEGKIA